MKWEPGNLSCIGVLKGHDCEGLVEKLLALGIVPWHWKLSFALEIEFCFWKL
jgi:hypothetical protein